MKRDLLIAALTVAATLFVGWAVSSLRDHPERVNSPEAMAEHACKDWAHRYGWLDDGEIPHFKPAEWSMGNVDVVMEWNHRGQSEELACIVAPESNRVQTAALDENGKGVLTWVSPERMQGER
jgi:hypothetical protein